jgi:flagellar biosynthesis/type III secretory pathway chaperone
MKEDAARRLQVVLEAEAGLYERLRDLLQEEREILCSLDASRLELLTQQKAALVDEGHVLESNRQAVVLQLATELSLAPEGLRLSVLCERLGRGHDGLHQAHNRLVVLVGVVRELLQANRSLAGQSLSEVRATLDALGGTLREGSSYGPDGNRRSTKGRLLRQCA